MAGLFSDLGKDFDVQCLCPALGLLECGSVLQDTTRKLDVARDVGFEGIERLEPVCVFERLLLKLGKTLLLHGDCLGQRGDRPLDSFGRLHEA